MLSTRAAVGSYLRWLGVVFLLAISIVDTRFVYSEAVNPWRVRLCWFGRDHVLCACEGYCRIPNCRRRTYRVCQQIEMRKGGSKIRSVDIGLSGTLWKKQSVTTGTKDIDSIVAGQIRKADWQDRLALAKDSGTSSKRGRPIFFVHGMHSTVRHNVSLEGEIRIQHEKVVRRERTVRESGRTAFPPPILQFLVAPP